MKTLSTSTFRGMLENGFRAIKLERDHINDLNVFPVPDGDTGTNMCATYLGGIGALKDLPDCGELAASFANGMLFGARGNSGVILSQFFSGLAAGLEGVNEITIPDFIRAFGQGKEKAYHAVVKPVEGTMLTVIREGYEFLEEQGEFDDYLDLFNSLLPVMERSLANTPELLDVLKEANVIDSGGAGIVSIMVGFQRFFSGETLEDIDFNGPSNGLAATGGEVPFDENSVLDYGYCTEFILQLLNAKDGPKNFVLQDMIDYLSTIGDSIVAVQNETIVKVHVHTKRPHYAIQYAQKFGEFVTFKMENMSIQHQEVLLKEMEQTSPRKRFAVVAVAPTEAIGRLFKDMGVTYYVLGGQTMNPSTEDFTKAFKKVNADHIVVFPNNGNVILTAGQAAELYKDSQITVIHSHSPMDCYSAISMIDFDGMSFAENVDVINSSIENLVSAEVVPAIRDSSNNGITIHAGDYMGLVGNELVTSGPNLLQTVEATIKGVPDFEDRSVITVFYGIDAKEEDKAAFRKLIKEKFRDLELVEIDGEQPVYPFIFGLE